MVTSSFQPRLSSSLVAPWRLLAVILLLSTQFPMGAGLSSSSSSSSQPSKPQEDDDDGKPDVFRYLKEPSNVESKCIFCKIGDGRIQPGKRNDPTPLVFENERLVAFDDIEPGASIKHFLVIPKQHLKNCWALTPALLEEMDGVANTLIGQYAHTNKDAANARKFFIRPPWNSVYHVHLHVMIGELTDSNFHPRKLGFTSPWFHITPDTLRDHWKRQQGQQ